jgi:cytoskeletal protein CcmA (bactofilin family)
MGAGRRSIKLSNLSAATPNVEPEVKAAETMPEAATEAVPEEPAVLEVSGAVMKEPEEPAVFEVSGAVMKEPEEAPAEAAPVEMTPIEKMLSEEPQTVEAPATEPEPAPQAISSIDTIVENSESIGEAIRKVDHRDAQILQAEVMKDGAVSDEVGIIAHGTKIHGDIVTDGHLEINGVVEGSINARGNVRVNGDVYGDIACGNLIIKEGVLKINVQAREDIALGEKARIEGDIRCRKIGIEGTIVGNITAGEIVQVAPSAIINGNITAAGVAIGMGAKVNGQITMTE